MKKIISILSFAVLLFTFIACNKDNEINDWREANTKAYEAITKNSNYRELKTETGPSGVFFKIIKSGTGTEYPLQTSKVKVFYKGSYYDGTVFDKGSSLNDVPVEFPTKDTVRGFSFALQNMVVGDKWEIWIPYYLGYGANGHYDSYTYLLLIKGYTTLIFEVELLSITQYPK